MGVEAPEAAPNFNTFNLNNMPHRGVYGLADELLPEMARAIDFEIGTYPTQAALQGLVKQYEYKWMLKNKITQVRQRLNLTKRVSAFAIATDWVQRSGIAEPLNRPYRYDQPQIEDFSFERTIITPTTGRGMMSQIDQLEQLAMGSSEKEAGQKAQNVQKLGQIHLLASARPMMASEHNWVANFIEESGKQPKEYDFVENLILPKLTGIGLDVDITRVSETDAFQIATAAAQKIEKSDRVLTISTAPIAIKAASQLRQAVRERHSRFDADTTSQLHVLSRGVDFKSGRKGTARTPLAFLSHIARTALTIYQNH